MNWLRILLLLCSCTKFGLVGEMVECSKDKPDAVPAKYSVDGLVQNNPFIPFKAGRSLSDNIDTSSDFDFLSVVIYPDHQEFSLKEKTKERPFWLSSDNSIKDENYGLVFWNFYPADKMLIVQDSSSGNLINIQQKEVSLGTSASASFYNGGNDWFSLLSGTSDDDDEDDDEILSKTLTRDKK